MYLSDVEYAELTSRLQRLENIEQTVSTLAALLQSRVLGCITEQEVTETIGDNGDEDGFLDVDIFIDIASHDFGNEMWLPTAHERISLNEYMQFLECWLKIIDNEELLESLITLGAIIMCKENKIMAGELKQVRDIRSKLLTRLERVGEYI